MRLAGPESWKMAKGRYYAANVDEGSHLLTLREGNRTLQYPVNVGRASWNGVRPGVLYGTAADVGKAALFRERDLLYDPKHGTLVPARRSYASFRLYARGLDDVAPLKAMFEARGIPVSTRAERIHDVKTLDRYLTLVFWLIAAIGIAGGMATLGTSLYGAVERKRRQLAVLRLLGISKGALFRFPVYQGLMIGLGGVTLALLFFLGMAIVTNRLFADYLQSGESFCRLYPHHLAVVVGGVALIALVASLLAAVKAMRSDPAEALREE